MDLVNSCWVEVRPLITSELEAANFAPVLDTLHSLGQSFRFFIVAPKDGGGGGGGERALVRFFFEFFDERSCVQMSNVMRVLMDVEVVSSDPSKHQYLFCADLAMAKNYALPIVFNGQRQELMVNLIDRLVASASGLGTCIEIVAKADPNAALDIQKFAYNKLSNKSSSGAGAILFDSLSDFLGAGIGKDPKNEGSTVKGGRFGQKVDAWSRELVKQAELKLASNLFTCQIRIWSNSQQNIQAVKKAMPAAPTNRLKTFKTTKKPQQHPTATLRSPSRYVVQNTVLCRLWWAVPLGLLLLTGLLGLFNPLKLVTSFSMFSVDLSVLVLVVFLAFGFLVVFRKRQPIVLSTQELAQIIGLPTAIEKLPVALGKVPIARMQLGHEQTQEQTNKTPQADKEQQNNTIPTQSSRHRLPTTS